MTKGSWENYVTKQKSTKINKQSTLSGLIYFDYFLIKPNRKSSLNSGQEQQDLGMKQNNW